MRRRRYTKESAVFFTLMLIAFGIGIVVHEIKKGTSKKIGTCFAGGLLALTGIGLLGAGIVWGVQVIYDFAFVVMSIFTLGFGLHHIFFVYTCSKKIDAIYVDAISFNPRRTTHYTRRTGYVYIPIFRYEYDGIEYEIKSLQSFSEKELKSRFAKNKVYQIYISPKNNEKCMVDKEVDSLYLLILFIGFIGLILSIYRILV